MTTPASPSRRSVLKGAALGAAAAAAGAGGLRPFDVEAAAAPARAGVFGYGVASGDPTADAVVIWTRATPPPARRGDPEATPGSGRGLPLRVRWEVARDRDFHHLVDRGTVVTSPTSDHTVKVDVRGLQPYTRYYYRFRARGETSPVGRTQTAPDERRETHALRFGLVSCSNYTGGYFGAYRALAFRDDLDFILHVGDYLYEYGNGEDRYGPAALVGERDSVPATETIDLQGYRLRHALHKADPDLRRAHRRHPWITIFDDHEVANNAWARGAENHTAGDEGAFLERRRQAFQAYLEWMPFRLPEQRHVPHRGTRFFKRFTYGSLADLSVLETRQNRSAQVNLAPYTTGGGGFIPTGLPATDAALADPDRHLLEPEQLAWLEDGTADRRRQWHLVANQVVLAPVRFPGAVLGAPAGTSLVNSDQWDGYQADQRRFLRHLAEQPHRNGDTVVLTGDIHSSWAMDLPVGEPAAGYRSAGVEFVCPSVTSDGFYELVRSSRPGPATATLATTRGLTTAVAAANPWVRYLDGVGHGYTLVDVTPDRVQADYHLTPDPTDDRPDPRIDPTVEPVHARSWQTLAGSRRVTAASGPVGDRSDHPAERRSRR
ncbi:alkaline phosphatase D [Friedmanniella luteola]|uniref:Alkaline phosphatase D n=1 Tax=Friedmanniella luteola TaxID=546871 RepID=A0A1H1WB92_9ACTN|nr:alkaline phosphatase D family protein [Friedmanniella luteola]SDS94354.1 alkaline phosphatase D [Friedmanniella luteola]